MFLFGIAADAATNEAGIKENQMYFLPKGWIKNYNVLIDLRNFYNQPINDLVKQHDEVRKLSAGQGKDFTAGCLLDYAYFQDNFRLIAVDLSKKALDYDPTATQQIICKEVTGGADDTKLRLYTILEKSKETAWEFYKGTAKVLWEHINGWIQ